MIIFDLDGTLADCEHRRHFIDPEKDLNLRTMKYKDGSFLVHNLESPELYKWKPDYEAYDSACEGDEPIQPVIDILLSMIGHKFKCEIWTGRSELVRAKTEYWINKHVCPMQWGDIRLKMRPIGNNEPVCDLKERWMFERSKIDHNHRPPGIKLDPQIEMVFDSDPDSIDMWKNRGIFVFDCRQGRE